MRRESKDSARRSWATTVTQEYTLLHSVSQDEKVVLARNMPAMLDFLAHGTLPGITALAQSKKLDW